MMSWMPDRREIIRGAALTGAILPWGKVRASLAGRAVDAASLLREKWDYVIVGGGSAGCVLARRLSEDAHVRVLLLEAGTDVHDAAVSAPTAWPTLAGGAFDWKYRSAPQAGLGGRSVPEPRGKGLGGSTLINALGFQRGPHQAYDRWAQETGDIGWGFAALLPYFKRLETASAGGDAWRGGDGPLHVLAVGDATDHNPLSVAYAEAGIATGHARNADWNAARADGTIWTQLTMRDGHRDTAASAFLDPVRDRANLGVVTGALVTRLRVETRRCTGVDLTIDGAAHHVSPQRETILSAGAFDSPRLMLLSGIGDADTLRLAGVPATHHLPGVGRNLHDHPLIAGLLYRAKQPVPVSHYNHCETMVIATSSLGPGWADLQLMGLSAPFLLPGLGTPPAHSFSIVPALMHPRSRGSLTVASADPRVPAIIDPNYLGDEADVAALVEGVEIARALADTPSMRAWVADEVLPGRALRDRAAIAAHVRRSVSPFFHPVSTCRMGRSDDAQAVVDTECRVRGLAGLRVVDASIFPSIPQAMTNAATLVVAERAADLVRHAA